MTKLKLASSNHIQIEKNVPMPIGCGNWPLGAMDVGDSFSADYENLTSVRGAVTYVQKKHPGKKFTVRSLPTEVRCWRTA